jgi:hypothetical protein
MGGRDPALASALIITACAHQQSTDMKNSSERVIAAVRQAYAAFTRGDIDSAVAPLDPSIEWTEPAEFPGRYLPRP